VSHFVDAVRRFFDPVVKAERMRRVVEEDNHVRYENETVFLDILFDAHRSYEISVVIGELPATETRRAQSFDLVDVLRMQAYPGLPKVGEMRGISPAALTTAVERLSILTKEHAARMLQHDEAQFEEVSTFRHWASLRYAWDADKHKSVAAAYRGLRASPGYESLKDRLTNEDLMILEKAKDLSNEGL
jgi:hypothetical protein